MSVFYGKFKLGQIFIQQLFCIGNVLVKAISEWCPVASIFVLPSNLKKINCQEVPAAC